jgi:hypothetical protein
MQGSPAWWRMPTRPAVPNAASAHAGPRSMLLEAMGHQQLLAGSGTARALLMGSPAQLPEGRVAPLKAPAAQKLVLLEPKHPSRPRVGFSGAQGPV